MNPKYEVSAIVRHARFGLGIVVRAFNERVHVYFPDRDGAEALCLKETNELLSSADDERDPRLEDLPPFEERGDKLCLPAGRLTQAQALRKFLSYFPRGFDDEAYHHGERAFKLAAHALYVEQLGNGTGERLLAEGAIGEISRRVLRVQARTERLLHVTEASAFQDGLKDEARARDYFAALFHLLAQPEPSAEPFDAYLAALSRLPQPGTSLRKWTVATLLPAMAQPATHIFIKPEVTRAGALRLAFDINYQPTPNWDTYRRVLRLGRRLLDELAPQGARDWVDINSFLWVVGAYDPPGGEKP